MVKCFPIVSIIRHRSKKIVTWEQPTPRVMSDKESVSVDQDYRLVHRKFIVALSVYRK